MILRSKARLGFAAATLSFLAVSACDSGVDPDATFVVDATVEFVGIEGGCWRLLADDGVRYEPLNLSAEFQQDGLAVRVALRRRTDVLTTCQVGEIVDVIGIVALDGG